MDETKAERLENFIKRHRVAITATVTVVATTAACIALNRLAGGQMREFIQEHNLWDEYITDID